MVILAASLRRRLSLFVLVLALSKLLWIVRWLVITLSVLLIGVVLSSLMRVVARTILRLVVVGIHLKLFEIETG